MSKKKSFEDELEKVEEIVDQMESGELGLEESLKAFEQGVKGIRHCEGILNKTRTRVQVLVGEEERDFDPADSKDNDSPAIRSWDNE